MARGSTNGSWEADEMSHSRVETYGVPDVPKGSLVGRQRHRLATAFFAILAVVISGLVFAGAEPAAAADGSKFDPGYIVSDENFYDGSAMDAAAVQQFLDSKNRCGSGSNCLAPYRQTTPSMPKDSYCAAMEGRPGESAASIIARVGAACNMSQKAILVLLEKEQSLVTSRSPSDWNWRAATGFSCPDNRPCDPAFAGFFYQVYYAARSFQAYKYNRAAFSWYKVNAWNNILWSEKAGCGTSRVFIRNLATLGLYFYTPYRPNAAALENLYGTGDSCSSYGNRNFWRLWTDWFGDPTVNSHSPIGVIKDMWATEDGIAFWGWALDPDVPTEPVQLRISVGGVVTFWSADAPYEQMATAAPGAGIHHGFGGTVAAPPGTQQEICVTMVNQAGGLDASLGCRTIDLPPRVSPRGELKELWASVDGVHMWGWTIDPDAVPNAVDLHIQVDSTWHVMRADAPYSLGPSLVEGAGPDHGFGGTLAVSPGVHRVCVTAINQNEGNNLPFGCRDVTVPSIADVSPKGEVKDVWGTAEGVSLWGWAADPDALDESVQVIVQVGSNWYAWQANQPNATVSAKVPGAGANHGWGGTIPVPPGEHWVCVYYTNINQGVDVNEDCRRVSVPVAVPQQQPLTKLMGAWQSAEGITLWGYAIDRDALNESAQVIVQVGSNWYAWTADAEYEPGRALYPGAGGNHGFVGSVPAPPGVHWVCAYSTNVAGDTSPDCVQVSVR